MKISVAFLACAIIAALAVCSPCYAERALNNDENKNNHDDSAFGEMEMDSAMKGMHGRGLKAGNHTKPKSFSYTNVRLESSTPTNTQDLLASNAAAAQAMPQQNGLLHKLLPKKYVAVPVPVPTPVPTPTPSPTPLPTPTPSPPTPTPSPPNGDDGILLESVSGPAKTNTVPPTNPFVNTETDAVASFEGENDSQSLEERKELLQQLLAMTERQIEQANENGYATEE